MKRKEITSAVICVCQNTEISNLMIVKAKSEELLFKKLHKHLKDIVQDYSKVEVDDIIEDILDMDNDNIYCPSQYVGYGFIQVIFDPLVV